MPTCAHICTHARMHARTHAPHARACSHARARAHTHAALRCVTQILQGRSRCSVIPTISVRIQVYTAGQSAQRVFCLHVFSCCASSCSLAARFVQSWETRQMYVLACLSRHWYICVCEHMCRQACGYNCKHMYRHLHGMCTDIYVDRSVDMCMNMCIDMPLQVSADILMSSCMVSLDGLHNVCIETQTGCYLDLLQVYASALWPN